MTIEENFILFNYDDEKLFLHISEPTEDDMNQYEIYELTSPYPGEYNIMAKRSHHKMIADEIPLSEWEL